MRRQAPSASQFVVQTANITKERGLLIVVEGLDRSGKSTQCDLLRKHIEKQGKKARYVKFPGLQISRIPEVIGIDFEAR